MLAEAIVAGATSVILGCLWLTDRIVGRALKPKPSPAGEVVRSWRNRTAPCALCGQDSYYLNVLARGHRLEWTCTICKGSYFTPVKPP